MIELKNLSKIYSHNQTSTYAIKDINLTVRAGEIFGIIGKSGAGKSTLLRCINLLEEPTTGNVIVDGQDLTQLNPLELRAARFHIAMIFQHFNLLASATVAENIALPMEFSGMSKSTINAKVKELAKVVALEDKIDAYPNQLSGGQKQRVAIARALACEPKVLLCDEATSALDPQSTNSILQLLKKINREYGLTIVLITHEIEVIKQICQRVAVMEQGEVIEQAQVLELFSHPKKNITKQLIADSISRNLSERIKSGLSHEMTAESYPVIQISFLKKTAAEPIISNLIRTFGVDINILQAYIEDIQQQPFGVITIQIMTQQTQPIIDYLGQLNLHVEVLGYVASADL